MMSRNKPRIIHDEAFFISCGEMICTPTFIFFGIFSRPYTSLICFQNGNSPKIKFFAVKALHLTFFAKLFRPYDYFFAKFSRSYVYSFLTNFPGHTFIPWPTSIPESWVKTFYSTMTSKQLNHFYPTLLSWHTAQLTVAILMHYYAWKMQAPRSHCFSPQVNNRHLW